MILALAGGVGGAKLAHGLQLSLAPDELLTIVNTGDDFDHFGLRICPDLDTVTYTLSGRANTEMGWGLAGESWNFLEALRELDPDTWFQLGDRDLATHAYRTRALSEGQSLSQVMSTLSQRLGVPTRIAPMSDDDVRTMVDTDEGELPFQEYFVRRRCEPRVNALRFEGASTARASAALDDALNNPALAAIIICPSNPFLSVAPMLSMPGIRERLCAAPAPVIGVSPIVGGDAIKGPAAKLMREFGLEPSATAVATHYGDLLDGFIIDEVDRALAPTIDGPEVLVAQSVMRNNNDRAELASQVIAFAEKLVAAQK
jgi:LPPG:FO 2-phospho-L-lactate transferase